MLRVGISGRGFQQAARGDACKSVGQREHPTVTQISVLEGEQHIPSHCLFDHVFSPILINGFRVGRLLRIHAQAGRVISAGRGLLSAQIALAGSPRCFLLGLAAHLTLLTPCVAFSEQAR